MSPSTLICPSLCLQPFGHLLSVLSLDRSPISSTAYSFTTTMNGSESPWAVTIASLQCLGDRCLSYRSPDPTGLPQVRAITFFAHPPSIHNGLRKGYWTSTVDGVSSSLLCLTKVHSHLSGKSVSSFFQIPHWPVTTRYSASCSASYGFFGHPCCFDYIFPPFRVMTEFTSASYRPCWAHVSIASSLALGQGYTKITALWASRVFQSAEL